VQTRRSARPAPTPKLPVSRRLEDVRQLKGFLSLRSFWAKLSENWRAEDGAVSYEAVRNYHYDREPPAAYLARVAEVFGFSLRWLITGNGPKTEPKGRIDSTDTGETRLVALKETVLRELGIPKRQLSEDIPYWVRSLETVWLEFAFTQMLRVDESATAYAQHGADTHFVGVMKSVAKAIAAPIEALGEIQTEEINEQTLGDYILSAVPSLHMLARERMRQWRFSPRANATHGGEKKRTIKQGIKPKHKPTKRRKS
jgi:hypothetical protein